MVQCFTFTTSMWSVSKKFFLYMYKFVFYPCICLCSHLNMKIRHTDCNAHDVFSQLSENSLIEKNPSSQVVSQRDQTRIFTETSGGLSHRGCSKSTVSRNKRFQTGDDRNCNAWSPPENKRLSEISEEDDLSLHREYDTDAPLVESDFDRASSSSIDPPLNLKEDEENEGEDEESEEEGSETRRDKYKCVKVYHCCFEYFTTKSLSEICLDIIEFIKLLSSVKGDIAQIVILVVSFWAIIFCGGWVCVNGIYYSFQQSLDWFLVVMVSLILEAVVLEPGIFLCCAAVSTQLWKRSHIINECVQRDRVVTEDLYCLDRMVKMNLVKRHQTSTVHTQAAPESASLFHLHDKIYKALKKVIGVPDVLFHTGVYWLIMYTLCILTLVNMQTDIYNGHTQKTYIEQALGLHQGERPISVNGMWDFIENRLHSGLIAMEEGMNLTLQQRHTLNASDHALGCMLITPVLLKQIRVRPRPKTNLSSDDTCSPLPNVHIDKKRQCNFEFTEDTMETGDFGFSWADLSYKSFHNRYNNVPTERNIFSTIDLLPHRGYKTIVHFDEKITTFSLNQIRHSDWLDEHTRYFLIDFSLLNLNSHIASSFRIRFDFRRPAPFWHVNSFHFRFEQPGNQFYYTALLGLFFINISLYNIIKETLLVNKIGPLRYFTQLDSYIEIIKVLLSIVMFYVYIRKQNLVDLLLRSLHNSYLLRQKNDFVNFLEMAVMDYLFTITGGFLAFLCIFQIFDMLSKIRRLLVFIRLLISAVTLFYMPLMTASAFAFLAYLLFGSTNASFSNFSSSYLMINQYFIKPRAIYEDLTDNHPFIGPWFVFTLGFCINFFMVNFFIVFLNEAYSSIINQVRINKYKVQEKTRLEYVYEFLGIESTITFDVEEDLLLKDRAKDRHYLVDIKRLQAI